jgi:hypothetical protein
MSIHGVSAFKGYNDSAPYVAIISNVFPDLMDGVCDNIERVIRADKGNKEGAAPPCSADITDACIDPYSPYPSIRDHSSGSAAPLFQSRGMGAAGNVRLGMLRGDRTCWITPLLCRNMHLNHIETLIRRFVLIYVYKTYDSNIRLHLTYVGSFG